MRARSKRRQRAAALAFDGGGGEIEFVGLARESAAVGGLELIGIRPRAQRRLERIDPARAAYDAGAAAQRCARPSSSRAFGAPIRLPRGERGRDRAALTRDLA
jgi:hypothetical protein